MMRVNQKADGKPLFDGAPNSLLLIGTALVSDLFKLNIDIHRWSMIDNKGYQREPDPKRVKMFAEYMQAGENISPDVLTLSIREEDVDVAAAPKSLGNNLYNVGIDTTTPVRLVDGQHRWQGLQKLRIDGNDQNLKDFEMPFILMYSVPYWSEIIEFMTRHKTQKGVKTDLGDQLLRSAVKTPIWKKLRPQLLANTSIWKNAEWTTKALDVIDYLRKDSKSVWHDQIIMPTEMKQTFQVCSQRTFTSSIKPFLVPTKRTAAPFEKVDADTTGEYLNAHWNAIKEVLPDAFLKFAQPKYAIWHLPGVYSLHMVYHKLLTEDTIGIGPALLDFGKRRQFGKLQAELKELYDVPAITTTTKWDKDYSWTDKGGIFGEPGRKMHGGLYWHMGSNHATFKAISGVILSGIQSKKKKEVAALVAATPKPTATTTKKESKK